MQFTNNEFEKFRLNFSICANCDVDPFSFIKPLQLCFTITTMYYMGNDFALEL